MPVTIYGGIGRAVFEGIERIILDGEQIALMDGRGATLIERDIPDIAPAVIQDPAILPANAALGDTVTLSLGLAEGAPDPVASWSLTRDGQPVTDGIDPETLSVTLATPGTYALSVSWSNAAGTVQAETAVLTVAVPVPDVVPDVLRQPAILPATAGLGATVTLDLGTASGTPAPQMDWDLTRNGLSIKASVDPGTLTLELAEPGSYSLTVGWSNRAGSVAAVPVTLQVQPAVQAVAPAITRQPTILPASAVIGDSITLDLGTATGVPAPDLVWDFTRDGVSIKAGLDAEALTMELSSAGAYALTASWSNSAGSVSAQTATLTVQAPPPAPTINYDTQTLVYFDAATAFAGSATDVTSITTRGTAGVVMSRNGSGAAIQRSAEGFVFANGYYLQSQVLTGLANTDGLFVVVDCTLTSYGANHSQIFDGAGGHVKIRNAAGTLQAVGTDDSTVIAGLGSVVYGSRMILAGMIDDVLNVVTGINTAGGDVTVAHPGLTDPELTRVFTGRYLNGTIHRFAVVGRREGQAWPVTMREVYGDFQRGA